MVRQGAELLGRTWAFGSVQGLRQSDRQPWMGGAGWHRFLWLIRASWLIRWPPEPYAKCENIRRRLTIEATVQLWRTAMT